MSNNRLEAEDFRVVKEFFVNQWKSQMIRSLRGRSTPDTRAVPGVNTTRTKEFLSDPEIIELQKTLNFYKKALSRHRKERDKTLQNEPK